MFVAQHVVVTNLQVKASAYHVATQEDVRAKLAIRNQAAHGHWGKCDERQVALFIEGIRSFIARFPA